MDQHLINAISLLPQDAHERFKKHLSIHYRNLGLHSFASGKSLARHLVEHKKSQGAGFWQIIKSTLNLANPFHHYKTYRDRQNNLNNQKAYGARDIEFAKLAQQAYNKVHERENINNWMYQRHLSDHDHAVYERDHNGTKQHALAIKGTSNFRDLLPDVNIALGKVDKSSAFKRSIEKFKQLINPVAVTGHSLGGARALWVGQNHNVESHVFNPGFVNFSEDKLDPNHPKAHINLIKGDPISQSILYRPNLNVSVLPSVSRLGIKNHFMTNFIPKVDNQNVSSIQTQLPENTPSRPSTPGQ